MHVHHDAGGADGGEMLHRIAELGLERLLDLARIDRTSGVPRLRGSER